MTSGVYHDGPVETLSGLFEEASEPVYLTNASFPDVERLVDAVEEFEGSVPEIRVLAEVDVLRRVRRDFLLSSRAVNYVDEGTLAFGRRQPTDNTTLYVSGDLLYVPVHIDTEAATVVSDDAAFIGEAFDWSERNWDAAEDFDLRTPPLSAVRETMDAEFSEPAREDFDRVLDRASDARDRSELDEVMATLLVAAKHELLHYDVSKWGEDIGLASKATFSRKKGELEEMNVLTTRKEKLEMGRPRQRLTFTDDYHERIEDNGLSNLVSNVVY
jgi:hypothetical protein